MKNIRVELRLSMLVHVGEDITEDGPPDREPDATECIKLVRVAHLGERTKAHDTSGDVLAGMMAGSAPLIAERMRHDLRTKGL